MGQFFLADLAGRPRVFFRGSCSNDVHPSETGLFGAGVYLTSDPLDAEQYGKLRQYNVISERPYYTRADFSRDDVDSPAIALIEELLDDEAEAFFLTLDEDGHIGDELKDILLDWGHDSLVVQWPDMEHVIVFDPEQLSEVLPDNNKVSKYKVTLNDGLSI